MGGAAPTGALTLMGPFGNLEIPYGGGGADKRGSVRGLVLGL